MRNVQTHGFAHAQQSVHRRFRLVELGALSPVCLPLVCPLSPSLSLAPFTLPHGVTRLRRYYEASDSCMAVDLFFLGLGRLVGRKMFGNFLG